MTFCLFIFEHASVLMTKNGVLPLPSECIPVHRVLRVITMTAPAIRDLMSTFTTGDEYAVSHGQVFYC